MHPNGTLALCFGKYIHAVEGIRMHRAHNKSWPVCANGNHAQIEWSPQLADLLESWTPWQVFVLCAVVIFGIWQLWNSAIAGISTIDR